MKEAVKAPFPYFGGKSRIASLVWERFGGVSNYVEPFFGSGAVLLARPHEPRVETVNDSSCFIANFWRAVQHAPDEVAFWADQPVNEADLHARHLWLVTREEWRERMMTDPEHFDAKVAGWWVWGASCWIGTGWCMDVSKTADGGRRRPLPQLSTGGQGVNAPSVARQIPHLGDAGRGDAAPGVARQIPALSAPGRGVASPRLTRKMPNVDGRGLRGDAAQSADAPSRQKPRVDGFGAADDAGRAPEGLAVWFDALAARLRRVRVCCGDWSRVTGPSVLRASGGVCGVFLDPPYAHAGADARMYGEYDTAVSVTVREWAIAHGDDPAVRIALCGYEGEHAMPDSWACVAWKATGGYGNRNADGNANAGRERVWFSPHCLSARQRKLFEEVPA
jgi:DNA adenine methylase